MKKFSYQFTSTPEKIKNLQEWFAKIITTPLVENHINPIAPNGVDIKQEASTYISASPTLMPYQRLEIYNQQYWWRLLNVLKSNFPFTIRLLDNETFQNLATQFLIKNPPNHWSLTKVGERFSGWLKKKLSL